MTRGPRATPAPGRRPTRVVVAALVAATATVTARRAVEAAPPGGRGRWTRTNHAGAEVTLLEGPAVVAGLALGSGAPLTALAAGGLGVLDDLAGDARAKGLRGHLGALRRGEVTTGAVKVGGLAATGLAVAARRARRGTRGTGGPADTSTPALPTVLLDLAVDTALVAGGANLANLLDLRPGRALKAAALVALPLALAGAAPAGAVLGVAAAALPDDLAGRTMLGDAGANALGAGLGAAAVGTCSRRTRLTAAAAVVGLTLLSERVSFTRVIAATPPLRALDEWGRPRPPEAPRS